MKTWVAAIVVAASVTLGVADTGTYQWARDFGGTTGNDIVKLQGTAEDAAGNVFVCGTFTGDVDFGGGLSLSTASSDYDGFVGKYSATGVPIWVKQIGSAVNNDGALRVAVDSNGDVAVAGYFAGTINFGGGGVASNGFNDGYVVKYGGVAGAYQWAHTFGGTNIDQASAITVDAVDEVIVGGTFLGTANFGLGNVTSAGGKDVFVVKYAANGTPMWGKRLGGAGREEVAGVKVGNGEVVAAGTFNGTVDLGAGPMPGQGNDDVFVVTWKVDGTLERVFSAGAAEGETLTAMGVGENGDVVIGGSFVSSVDFGGGVLTNEAAPDMYVAELETGGGVKWSKQFGLANGSFGETAGDAEIDSAGNAIVVGSILEPVDFGGGPLWGNGSYDPFAVKFAGTGTYVWGIRWVGDYSDDAYSVTTDVARNVIVGGVFWEQMDFGGGPLYSSFPSGTDGFVVKLNP